jgi:hypothetical protein
MITIDPKFKKDIKLIQEFNKTQDEIVDFYIQKLGERIGLKTPEEHETLWDHIMNGSDWTVEYKKEKKK